MAEPQSFFAIVLKYKNDYKMVTVQTFYFICYCEIRFSQIRIVNSLAKARKYSIRSPLGRRWYLISKPASSGICEFSTA